MAQVTSSEIKNISAWRLNKAETQELADRVKKGESEAEVKRKLQTKKALACEERKRSAVAISSKGSTDHKPSAGSKSKKLPAKSATAVDLSKTDPTNASYYRKWKRTFKVSSRHSQGLTRKCRCVCQTPKRMGQRLGFKPRSSCRRRRMLWLSTAPTAAQSQSSGFRSCPPRLQGCQCLAAECLTWQSFTSRMGGQLS